MSAPLPLFSSDPLEVPAAHCQPGDWIRRNGAIYEVDHVTIPHGLNVTIKAFPKGQVGASCVAFSLAPDEIVRLVKP